MRDFRAIFPAVGSEYQGTAVSFWFLVVMAALTTARSLAHMFLPDGGAEVIAGLPLSGAAIDDIIIGIFGQWGLEQLLLASVSWVVILRYRFLVPFALLLQLLDLVGRFCMAQWKPVWPFDTPPCEIGHYMFIPFVAIALWYSLPRREGG